MGDRFLRRRVLAAGIAAITAFALTGCLAPSDGDPGAQLEIRVAPLALPGVVDVTYSVTVRNADLAVVWTRSVSSAAFGDGRGSATVVGPCDATGATEEAGAPATVELVITGIITTAGALVEGVDFMNPAPAGTPLTREASCRANEDARVDFDVTVARRAEQGFLDVAVSFEDVHCSAKLDCVRAAAGGAPGADEPLLLLHDADGERSRTVVLGLTCVGGPGEDITLYLDELELRCGEVTTALSPGGGPGLKGPVAPWVFEHAVYQGEQASDTGGLGPARLTRYWNVAVGLDEAALPVGEACTLVTRATASAEPFVGLTAPASATRPELRWDVTLKAAGADTLTCGRHGLDADAGVTTHYATGASFATSFPESGLALTLTSGNVTDLVDVEVPMVGEPFDALRAACSGGFELTVGGDPAAYCFEQPNGECSPEPSDLGLWVKVASLPAATDLDVVGTCVHGGGAAPGEQVFRFYDDFNGETLSYGTPNDGETRWFAQGGPSVALSDGTVRIRMVAGAGVGFFVVNNDIIAMEDRVVFEHRMLIDAGTSGEVDVIRFQQQSSGSEFILQGLGTTLRRHYCDRCGNPSASCPRESFSPSQSAHNQTWQRYAIVKDGDANLHAQRNGVTLWTRNQPCAAATGYRASVGSRTTGHDIVLDWARIRNRAPVTPTFSL